MLRAVSADDGQPTFSPSGRQLAFTTKAGRRRNINVMTANGAKGTCQRRENYPGSGSAVDQPPAVLRDRTILSVTPAHAATVEYELVDDDARPLIEAVATASIRAGGEPCCSPEGRAGELASDAGAAVGLIIARRGKAET